jgi:hypothetical protein
VQFSRVPLTVKMGKINWSCGTLEWAEMKIWSKNNRGSRSKKNPLFFPEKHWNVPPVSFYDENKAFRVA